MNLNNGGHLKIKNKIIIMLQCMLGTSIGQNSSVAPSMHCCMSFILFLMVTIVEVHKLILDVYVSLVPYLSVTTSYVVTT